ncbi:MAG: hypothetical protein J5892_03535 [Bacilli bacterium]|nr:hypothetical protein [Bacilli bacterium]
MQKNTFVVETDDALLYLDFLNENKGAIDLLISFFEELMEFRRMNDDHSEYYNEVNCHIVNKYPHISEAYRKKCPYIMNFINKYQIILYYLNESVFNHRWDRHYAISKVFNTYNYSKDAGYKEEDVKNILEFLYYVKNHYNRLKRITEVVERISQANICSIEMDSKKFKRKGLATVDFQFKEKYQSGYRTLFPFTNGTVTKSDGEGNIYHYAYENADFLVNLIIDPVFKKQFDFNEHLGFYDEGPNLKGTRFTDRADQVNHIFDALNRTILVGNLLFDKESLPVPFMLDNTLFRVLPEIKEKTNYNKNIYECNELLGFFEEVYINMYNINEDNVKDLEQLKYKDGRSLKDAYLDMKIKMLQLGFFRKYSHVKLELKDKK